MSSVDFAPSMEWSIADHEKRGASFSLCSWGRRPGLAPGRRPTPGKCREPKLGVLMHDIPAGSRPDSAPHPNVRRRHAISLKQFVLVIVAAAGGGLVWNRTHGDFLLASVTPWFVFHALFNWV